MSLWELADLSTPWCIHVVVTLEVANFIEAGHSEIQAIAAAAKAEPDALQRVLRHLVDRGLFTEPTPGHFALNEPARELLSPGARLGFHLEGFGGRMAHVWTGLLTAVRTGRPGYSEVFGRDFWADLAAHPDLAAQFDDLMGPAGHGVPDGDVLPDPADWASIRTVADVGGGTGSLLAEVLRHRPALCGILIDLPSTVARAQPVLQAAGVADRVTLAGQSFFDPLPSGADIYLLSKVLGDWPDAETTAILRRCAEAAHPNGRVIVFNGAAPGEPADPSLLMLVLVGGKERTVEELTQLAENAGLTRTAIGRQASGRTLVEFRPQRPMESSTSPRVEA